MQSIESIIAPINTLIREAAKYCCVTVEDLKGPKKSAGLTMIRHAIYMVARDKGASAHAIGRRFNRDHTTIIHGLQKAEYLYGKDPVFTALVNYLGESV